MLESIILMIITMLILQFILAHRVIEIISRIRIFKRESKQDLVIHPNVVRLSSKEAFCCRKFTTSLIMKGQLKNQHLASQTVWRKKNNHHHTLSKLGWGCCKHIFIPHIIEWQQITRRKYKEQRCTRWKIHCSHCMR